MYHIVCKCVQCVLTWFACICILFHYYAIYESLPLSPGLLGSSRQKDQRQKKQLLGRGESRRGMPLTGIKRLGSHHSLRGVFLDMIWCDMIWRYIPSPCLFQGDIVYMPMHSIIEHLYGIHYFCLHRQPSLRKLFNIIHLWHDLHKHKPEGIFNDVCLVASIALETPYQTKLTLKQAETVIIWWNFQLLQIAALQLAAESKGEGARLKHSVRSTEIPWWFPVHFFY